MRRKQRRASCENQYHGKSVARKQGLVGEREDICDDKICVAMERFCKVQEWMRAKKTAMEERAKALAGASRVNSRLGELWENQLTQLGL